MLWRLLCFASLYLLHPKADYFSHVSVGEIIEPVVLNCTLHSMHAFARQAHRSHYSACGGS